MKRELKVIRRLLNLSMTYHLCSPSRSLHVCVNSPDNQFMKIVEVMDG